MPAPAAAPVLDSVAFTIDGNPVTWGEVVEDASARGVWDPLAQRARESAACLALARAAGREPTRAAVQEEGARFRQERRLTAAEDMEAWLAGWGLTVTAWLDHVRRTLAHDARGSEDRPAGAGEPADAASVGRTWASAVCSGAVEQFATDLAGRLAIRTAIAEAGAQPTASDEELRARHRERVVTAAAVDAELRARPLDWTRLDVTELRFTGDGAAREARLCLVDDGDDAVEVARRAGAALAERATYLEDVPPDHRATLLGARSGEVIGPLPDPAGPRLLVVRNRSAPSTADPQVRRRAEGALLARARRKEIDDRVSWVGPG